MPQPHTAHRAGSPLQQPPRPRRLSAPAAARPRLRRRPAASARLVARDHPSRSAGRGPEAASRVAGLARPALRVASQPTGEDRHRRTDSRPRHFAPRRLETAPLRPPQSVLARRHRAGRPRARPPIREAKGGAARAGPPRASEPAATCGGRRPGDSEDVAWTAAPQGTAGLRLRLRAGPGRAGAVTRTTIRRRAGAPRVAGSCPPTGRPA